MNKVRVTLMILSSNVSAISGAVFITASQTLLGIVMIAAASIFMTAAMVEIWKDHD